MTKYTNPKDFLGKEVDVIIERPIGSEHPLWKGHIYDCNYGYIPNTIAPDGKEVDVFLLNINKPVKKYKGKVIAIIHRTNDNDDKLVVSANNKDITDEEIRTKTNFQEKYFESIIIR